jgi:hypothetical protein
MQMMKFFLLLLVRCALCVLLLTAGSCSLLTIAPVGAVTGRTELPLTLNNFPASETIVAIELTKHDPQEQGSGGFPLVQNIEWNITAFCTSEYAYMVQRTLVRPRIRFTTTPSSASPFNGFNAGGMVGCNQMGFTYLMTSDGFVTGNISTTLAFCTPYPGLIERLYYAFMRAQTYTVSSDRMTIFLRR